MNKISNRKWFISLDDKNYYGPYNSQIEAVNDFRTNRSYVYVFESCTPSNPKGRKFSKDSFTDIQNAKRVKIITIPVNVINYQKLKSGFSK